ncbi:MAG TPA: hypothetical protein VNL77_14830 [Roseiflexaceae bacterium]|nr:hypothetical protein [Roseiflexaceae bacterium]
MASNGPGWEGTILAFVMTFTVLLGVAYTLGVVYRVAVPWLAILAVSALVAAALRYRRRPRP